LATLTARVDALAEAQARTEQQLATLTEAQARTEQRVATLGSALTDLTRSVEDLRGRFQGAEVERQYQQHAPAYFGRFARGLRIVDKSDLADLLDDAGVSEEERLEVLVADLVLVGRRREDGRSIYLVVEISAGVGRSDVERADRRARILRDAMQRLGRQEIAAIAIVAGQSIDTPARALATERGVWQVRDGHVTAPGAP
ncbi:MAG: hypothetical protein HY690_11350, partial [Chloroflexi bacterium]|nr:hypothetical protein [Chloroflexota bacterium]